MARRDLDDWFWQVGSELQRLSDEMFRVQRSIARRRSWEPRADVFEDDAGRIVIRVELAGVRSEDIQMAYISQRNSILIRGARHDDSELAESMVGCHQLEIYYGEFQREIELPRTDIDPTRIRMVHQNGFLYVLVPTRTAVDRRTRVHSN